MGMRIKSPKIDDAIFRKGKDISKSDRFRPLAAVSMPEGGLCLRGKVLDSFNFVDYAEVDLDRKWKAITGYRCDCPESGFCKHCVAVLMDFVVEPVYLEFDGDDKNISEEAMELQAPQMPVVADISYQFCNARWDLYPGAREPQIPLERFRQAFGPNARAAMLYRWHGKWGGSCFGMSATASMFRQGNEDTCVSDFNETVSIPSELKLVDHNRKLEMTLHQYIELVHILQYSGGCSYGVNQNLKNPECLNDLVARTKAFQQGQGAPVLMCVFRSPKMDGGHAILPFQVETVAEGEDLLHIYDPNYPMQTRYAYLTKNEEGRYLDWRFPMTDSDIYSGEADGRLSMCTYEAYTSAWKNRGSSEVDNVVTVRGDVVVKNSAGELLVQINDGILESLCEDIYQIPVMAGGQNDNMLIALPAGQYVFTLEDPRQNDLYVHMAGTDLSVEVTTAAREIMVQLEDAGMVVDVQICQKNKPYMVEILNTSGMEEEVIYLNGITGEEALHLFCKDGQLSASGIMERCTLYINDVPEPLERIEQLTDDMEQQEKEEELVCNNASSPKKADDAE